MQALLEDLNSLPGVVGSMFCDAHNGVLSRAFPTDVDESSLTAIASALASSTPELKTITGPVGVLDLRYRDARVVIRPAGDASLVVLCDKSANAQEVLAFASVACKKYERLQNPGAVTGTFAAPVPVLSSGTAVDTTALAVRQQPGREAAPPPPPRRRTGAMIAVAFLALLLGAGGAFGAYVLWGQQLLGGRAQPGTVVGTQTATTAPARRSLPAGPVQVKLRLSGADALAADLVPALAAAFLESQKVTDIETAKDDNKVVVKGAQDGAVVGIEITAGGTAKGLEDLLGGGADIAVATRRIKPAEREKLAVLGQMTSSANEHVIGLDGIAVIVNKANSVAALNREQLASILSGAASDWSMFGLTGDEEFAAVGTAAGPVASGVHVYLPDDRSGIPEVVQAAVLGNKSWAKDAQRLPTYQAVTDAVIGNAGGIGIVPMVAITGARSVPVSDLDDMPLTPTVFTVASEDYLLTHRLYLYTAQASPNAQVARFVDFALSSDGQAVVNRQKFVPLSVAAEGARAVPRGAPPEFVRLTSGAKKLTSTFRFEPGSSAFDSRAQRDLDRVVEYLRENQINGNAVRVLGFADAMGSAKVNQQLSAERATQVAQQFAQRGITGVTIAGLGSALPVADNAGEEGRRRNRRVEIWVTR